jgi:hypothetical protein
LGRINNKSKNQLNQIIMKTLEKFIDFMSKFLFDGKHVMPWVLLLTVVTATAQPREKKPRYAFVTYGIDLRNAVDGSKPTQGHAELNNVFKIGARDNHLEIAAFYENFKRIEFQAYGININGVTQVFKNTDLAVGIELGSIIRNNKGNFLMAGLNGELRYDFGWFFVGGQLQCRLRTDNWRKDGPAPIVMSGLVTFSVRLN